MDSFGSRSTLIMVIDRVDENKIFRIVRNIEAPLVSFGFENYSFTVSLYSKDYTV